MVIPNNTFNLSIVTNFKRSISGWIIISEKGEKILSYPRDYDVISLGLLKSLSGTVTLKLKPHGKNCKWLQLRDIINGITASVKDVFVTTTKTTDLTGNFNNSKLCHRIYSATDDDLPRKKYFYVSPPWKEYEFKCYTLGCLDKSCATFIRENELVYTSYVVAHIIIVYSPLLLYVLMDYFRYDHAKLHFYTKEDKPYGLSRFVLTAVHSIFCSKHCKGFTKNRNILNVCIIIWLVNVLIHSVNLVVHIKFQSHESAFGDSTWFKNATFNLKEVLATYGIYCLGLLVVVLILNVCTDKVLPQLEIVPYVYCFSSSAQSKNCFLVRTNMLYFKESVRIFQDEEKEMNDQKTEYVKFGKQLLEMQTNRLFLITNVRFWKHLIRQSFSYVTKKKKRCFRLCITLLPALPFCVACFVLGILMNIVWGLFPMVGLFMTCVSSVRSYKDFFKLCIMTVLCFFFVQNIYGDNILFLLNTFTFTIFVGIPLDTDTSLPIVAKVLPILIYFSQHWSQFSTHYKEILDIIFEVKDELLNGDGKETCKENNSTVKSSRTGDSNDDPTLHVQEFDFICSKVLSKENQIVHFISRLTLTVVFLMFTISVFFMTGNVKGFDMFSKLIFLFVIIITPGGIQLVCKSDDESRKAKYRQKVILAVQEWREKQNLVSENSHKDREPDVEVVKCFCHCCYEMQETKLSNEMIDIETGSMIIHS